MSGMHILKIEYEKHSKYIFWYDSEFIMRLNSVNIEPIQQLRLNKITNRTIDVIGIDVGKINFYETNPGIFYDLQEKINNQTKCLIPVYFKYNSMQSKDDKYGDRLYKIHAWDEGSHINGPWRTSKREAIKAWNEMIKSCGIYIKTDWEQPPESE